MRATLRTKLWAIVAVDALALLILIVVSSLMQQRVDDQLHGIRERILPRIGLGPRLGAQLDRLERSLQDAGAAGDEDLLETAARNEQDLLAAIDGAGGAIVGVPDQLRAAIEDYFQAAELVAHRLIAGESGAALDDAIRTMKAREANARTQLDAATRVDPDELARVFARSDEAQQTASTIRLTVSGICLLSVIALLYWLGRGVFRNLNRLSDGFRRFGGGDFDAAIPIDEGDELGEVAQNANQMAARLRTLDWQRRGHAGLVEHLQGKDEPEAVADRAISFLARHLGAPAGALYYQRGDGALVRLGHYGLETRPSDARAIRPGEGLIGEAARHSDVTVIEAPADLPAIRTSIAELRPCGLALVPLVHLGKVVGVVELVLVRPWTVEDAELVVSGRESVTIAIEEARARADTRRLLGETQRQAAELLEARRRLELKADELSRASAVKSQFLASMSHELRTPLNAIIGFSELLHDGAVPPDAPQHHEFVGHILTSGRHLLKLVNDILDLSKVEAGRFEFHPESIQLTVVLDEVLAILRTVASNAGLRVESSIDPAVDALVLDPARLKQVLYNLISNALKFTPRGGRVMVRATPEPGDRVRIEIEDTGIGIEAAQIEQLFREFQQVGDHAGKAGGTGLGLALTKRLVEAQGGSVGVDSTPGKGSVFHVVLPRTRREEAAVRSTRTPRAATSAGEHSVLVIEDDAGDQAKLVAALGDAGYEVEVVSTGAAALARARARRFDAVTLDLFLPDMTGLEVLRELRADSKYPEVPVVVITVVTEPGAVAGFAVADVLPKPVDREALLASLTRAGVPPSASREVLVVDDDASSLQLMASLLTQLGYTSRCERDAVHALESVRHAVPNAIVLDLIMPGMSGFEFLDVLRGAPEGREVPVIVWTSKDLSAAEKDTLRASANAIVSKGHGGSERVLAELAAYLPPRSA